MHAADNHSKAMAPSEALYNVMSREADGTYRQMITICTAFLGGTLVFFEKLFIGDEPWTIYLLFAGWGALTFTLTVLCLIRWQNVEAHRHILEYFKTESEADYEMAIKIAKLGRRWMLCALISMVGGVILVAGFTAINIISKY